MIVKVCGMREPENIRAVAALGVDMLGFIFCPGSPRTVPAGFRIPEGLPPTLRKVGVFVNAPAEEMMETATTCRLDYLQLHGDETPDLCHKLQKRGFSLIKAFSLSSTDDLQGLNAYEGYVDYFLFDARSGESRGGTGKCFDWSLLHAYRGATPFLLAGGLRPDSLDSLRTFRHSRFAGIDLNSGFETAPGYKDAAEIKNFLLHIRA